MNQAVACCHNEAHDSYGDCDNAGNPQGPGYKIMAKYVASEQAWLDDYTSAWKVATTNGHTGLRYLDQTKADPEPIIDQCAALTGRGKTCKTNKRCIWSKTGRTVTMKNGTVRTRGACVPFSK